MYELVIYDLVEKDVTRRVYKSLEGARVDVEYLQRVGVDEQCIIVITDSEENLLYTNVEYEPDEDEEYVDDDSYDEVGYNPYLGCCDDDC